MWLCTADRESTAFVTAAGHNIKILVSIIDLSLAGCWRREPVSGGWDQ